MVVAMPALSLLLLALALHGGRGDATPPPLRLVRGARHVAFDEGYTQIFGDGNLVLLRDGRRVHLSLDESTGAGFASQDVFLHGFFSAAVKLPADYAAGVVVAFYLSNGDTYEKTHDEVDFEFLGNVRGREWRVQTNVYGNGSTAAGREERYDLPFDPSDEFHHYSILWTRHRIMSAIPNLSTFTKKKSIFLSDFLKILGGVSCGQILRGRDADQGGGEDGGDGGGVPGEADVGVRHHLGRFGVGHARRPVQGQLQVRAIRRRIRRPRPPRLRRRPARRRTLRPGGVVRGRGGGGGGRGRVVRGATRGDGGVPARPHVVLLLPRPAEIPGRAVRVRAPRRRRRRRRSLPRPSVRPRRDEAPPPSPRPRRLVVAPDEPRGRCTVAAAVGTRRGAVAAVADTGVLAGLIVRGRAPWNPAGMYAIVTARPVTLASLRLFAALDHASVCPLIKPRTLKTPFPISGKEQKLINP